MKSRARIQYFEPAAGGIRLLRRGVDHGDFRAIRSEWRAARELWETASPVLVPGLLREVAHEHAASIRRTQALFTRLAEGRADPSQEIWRRVGARSGFSPAGSSIDAGDPREIEKVHADGTRPRARDLWAKFSWIRPELADDSLRIRFSFGEERAGDWLRDGRRRAASNRFCEAVFAESRAIATQRSLRALLRRCAGRELTMAERIVFANAPGGGARFHHDAEPTQRGVLYVQLAGRTAWLALPKRELAALLLERFARRCAATTARALLRRLDGDALDRLLNSTPAVTRELAARGALHVLRRGDVLLLPSHGPDDCAWHSVFALGRRPSLAHSYGLFAKSR